MTLSRAETAVGCTREECCRYMPVGEGNVTFVFLLHGTSVN
jgi:hypothetical protein